MLMARLARIIVPGIPHHVIQRGNRKQKVFFSDDDRLLYLSLITKYCLKHKVSVWAYCLMDNHVHFIAVPSDAGGLRSAFGEAHRMYSRSVNLRENWRGYLFQGRFISYPMDEHHTYVAVRYVECNPVRAKMVLRPEYYAWSSARAHIFGLPDPVLSADVGSEIRKFLGITDWRVFLCGEEMCCDLDAVRHHAKTGRPLGSESFVKELEKITGRVLQPYKRKVGTQIIGSI